MKDDFFFFCKPGLFSRIFSSTITGTNPFCVSIVIFHYMLLSYVFMRSALFWVITQDMLVIPYRRFGTTYLFHLQECRTSRFWLLLLFSLMFFCSPLLVFGLFVVLSEHYWQNIE